MLFQLLDYHAKGKLIQAEILDSFKEKLRWLQIWLSICWFCAHYYKHNSFISSFDTNERHRELVNFLDTSFYVHAGDKDLDFELFMRVLRSKRVSLFLLFHFNLLSDETSYLIFLDNRKNI